MLNKKKHIHIMGIGGIGMSGIASFLADKGFLTSGCDSNISDETYKKLSDKKCIISKKHCDNNVCYDESIDILVHSSAIYKSHPEIEYHIGKKNKILNRAALLAEIIKPYTTIAVAGSHGKTTTSSMISQILLDCSESPNILIGGNLNSIKNNYHPGESNLMVIEADESDKTIEQIFADTAIVTNIDLEHLETYKNIDEIKKTFEKFLANVSVNGQKIVCIDNKINQEIINKNKNIITYGIDSGIFMAKNINLMPSFSNYDLYINDKFITDITLNIPGRHNIYNSLAAVAAAYRLNLEIDKIKESLFNFQGVERRLTYHGKYKKIDIYDDYAHHPTEIDSILSTIMLNKDKRIKVVFQPHRYSRTYHLWNDFIDVFTKYDINELIITDIYSASENPINNVTSKKLVEEIRRKNKQCYYISANKNFLELESNIKKNINKNEIIIFLGAGKLNNIAVNLTKNRCF